VAKKRATRRRASDRGATEQQRRRERLETRRRAREQALAAAAKAQRRRRVLRSALTGLLAGAVVWLLFLELRPAPTPDAVDGHRVEKFGESGVAEHVAGPVDYDSSPPTHGPHSANAAACGVHGAPIPNETMVHSLEHGAVGIVYRASLDLADIRSIERTVRGYDGRVFSAPYSGNMSTPIAVLSWGEMMRLQSLDERAVRDYISAFRGTGPEDTPCPDTADSPFSP
jgi:Protein of unknown function (DUF3105)